VKTVTGAVSAIAATATEREFGVWQADPEDVEGIAHPATRIIWRRLPDDAKGSDVVDLLGLALSLAAYVGKNFVRRAEIRGAIERGEITVAAPAEPVS
jgi:hypothetical protein